MRQRIDRLISLLNEGVYEKDTELRLSMLAALAGQSILLLGPPGVAKSMIAHRLKYAFRGAKAFEYLMSRFSTPDEIFGPVSIARLKDSDKYERNTTGYLPDSDVVFLDEIWKAGPAIQNTLLTVINEKTFLNGDRQMKLPLKLLVAASNELPARNEGLEALWDRFIIRIECNSISDDRNFLSMVTGSTQSDLDGIDANMQITQEEYHEWQSGIDSIEVPEDVQQAILLIRKGLHRLDLEGTDAQKDVYVSDRRWKNIVRLLRTSALMHGRDKVMTTDLLITQHCLWSEPEDRNPVTRCILSVLISPYQKRLAALQEEVNVCLKKKGLEEALQESARQKSGLGEDLLVHDGFYYRVEGHDDGNTFIYIADFHAMPNKSEFSEPVRAMMYVDDQKRRIIRIYEEPGRLVSHGYNVTTCQLERTDHFLYINGVEYLLEMQHRGEDKGVTLKGIKEQPQGFSIPDDLERRMDGIEDDVAQLHTSLLDHLFVSAKEKEELEWKITKFRQQAVLLRNDLNRLLHGDNLEQ